MSRAATISCSKEQMTAFVACDRFLDSIIDFARQRFLFRQHAPKQTWNHIDDYLLRSAIVVLTKTCRLFLQCTPEVGKFFRPRLATFLSNHESCDQVEFEKEGLGRIT